MTENPILIEQTAPHTGLLRLGLAVEQSVAFWAQAGTEADLDALVERAHQEKWFPNSSESRNRYLVQQLARRFSPQTRSLLAAQAELSPPLVCHWHLQLTDPIYRLFTGSYLMSCWSSPTQSVGLEGSVKWVSNQALTIGWRVNTIRRMASGLLSSATEAGLCRKSGRKERELWLPAMTSSETEYLNNLLESVAALENRSLYLLPVGLTEEEI